MLLEYTPHLVETFCYEMSHYVFHLVNFCIFLLVVGILLPPFVTGMSNTSDTWRLVSGVVNSCAIVIPLVSMYTSMKMSDDRGCYDMTGGIVACGTITRGAITIMANIAACSVSWVYYANPGHIELYGACLALVIISSIGSLVGMSIAFGVLYPEFLSRNSHISEKSRLYHV